MDNNDTYLEKHREIESSFISFFEEKGYRRLDSVPTSSHVDRSAFLVDSATNLFKPHFFQINVYLQFSTVCVLRLLPTITMQNKSLRIQLHLIRTELLFL